MTATSGSEVISEIVWRAGKTAGPGRGGYIEGACIEDCVWRLCSRKLWMLVLSEHKETTLAAAVCGLCCEERMDMVLTCGWRW